VTLLWEAFTALLTPLIALVAALTPRLRAGLRERLGFPYVEVEPGAVWVHAASLGEGRAAAALIAAIRVARPDLGIVRTWTSNVAATQDTGADQTLAGPLESPFFVGAWLDRVRPRCLVLVEAELWPDVLAACRRREIPVVVVNARVGRGARRLLALGLWRALTRDVLFFAPDAPTAAILGGEVTGDLKVEAPRPPPVLTWSRPAIVAGSTHPGEEDMLLHAVAGLVPRPLLVLAPRDPGRFEAVATRLATAGVSWARRSALRGEVPAGVDVVLLDSLGELAGLYDAADAAFVGGTFLRDVGGHSPAEARAAGCPVVTGPHTHANPGAWDGVRAFHAVSPDALGSALTAALAAGRQPVGVAAVALETVGRLAPVLDAPTPAEPWLRWWLTPLVPVWALGVRLRRGSPRRASIPVIVVGGLTAGGAGKTPVAGWLAGRLAHLSPAVVARGYGRLRGGDVRTEGEATELGDELAMLARRGITVVSSPDRHAGVAAAAEDGARLAILDDALLVPSVIADLTIVVVDARWPSGGGPIPVGTGRVPARWLSRADVVWVNHGPLPEELRPHLRPDAVLVEARYDAVGWVFRGTLLPLDALPARDVVAFAGVARPEGFFGLLRRLGLRVVRTGIFPDHHHFRWADLQNIEAWLDDHVVTTTEKDAARLPPDAGVHALRVEPVIVRGADALDAVLRRFDGSA
jgi:3-deoxy-D-manno-octulosonic-acid transferase